ncbi:MAG: ABC transporter permease [Terracidiphilus sp.]|jgi:predicted permease
MLLQDFRFALRQLRRAPGFTLTVALTLALSVGAATAVFCVIDTVILRPLPYAHPERIVSVNTFSRSRYFQPASWPAYQEERAQAQAFAALAAYIDYEKVTLETPSGSAMLTDAVRSSENFFQVFGVRPLLGRTFLPGEEQEGRNDVAVLSYELWQKDFGGDPGIVNRAIKLDGRAYTVVGIMPAGFRFPLGDLNAVYTPIHLDKPWMIGRGNHWLQRVARLKDGVTMGQAQADLSHVLSDLGRAYPDTDEGRTVQLEPLAQTVSGQSKGPLWTLLGAVLAVLAIGCVNVAGLLLARGVKREREMAMRTAVGAPRGRLVRLMLTEGVVLALVGAAGGVALAWGLLSLMRSFLIHALARGADIQLNWTVLGAAVVLAIAASLTAAIYPALRLSGVDPNRALKAGGSAGTGRGQHRLRAGFVVTQVALTLVLLVVSGLLIRVVTRYRHTDLGFNPSRILAVHLNFSPPRYEGRDVIADLYQPLLDRVTHQPGVRAAGLISILPIHNWGSNSDIHIAGQPPYPPNQEMLAENRFVSTGYFNVFGIPLRGGRALTPALDRVENTAPTVVVNEAFVKKFVPANLDPAMQRMDDDDKQEKWTRIVGVTGSIRQDIYEAPLAERDWLIDEIPMKERGQLLNGMWLVVRSDGDPKALIPSLRGALHDVDATIPFENPRTMDDVVSETLVFERMESWLFSIFAGLAVTLALVGLYGLVSHEVEQSRRDIGVRMALGATRNRVLSAVMQRVAWMLAAGAAVGLVLTVCVRKIIGMVIHFDAQKDAGGFLLLALLLVAAGLLAALMPAMRAASIEPMQALRNE